MANRACSKSFTDNARIYRNMLRRSFTTIACLLSVMRAQAQSWSPDGKQIVIPGASLLLADAQAAGALASVTTPRTKPSPTSLLTSAANPVAALPNVNAALAPAWSPDSRTLAYLADAQTLSFYDTLKQQRKSLNDNTLAPIAWSRDSALFASIHKTESGNLQALIRYRSGGGFLPAINLPFHSVPSTYLPLGWIANTTNVIVAGGDNGKYDLYLLDQGEVVRLTSTGDVLGFVVSADGATVRWVRRSPNTRYILLSPYEMNIDTRTIRKLPFPDVVKAVNPTPHAYPDTVSSVVFTPDMSQFAFVTTGGLQAGTSGSALWISDITGQNVRFVGKGMGANNGQTTSAPVSASQQTGLTFPAYVPAFSPNGKYLATVRNEAGKRALVVTDAATGQSKTTALP